MTRPLHSEPLVKKPESLRILSVLLDSKFKGPLGSSYGLDALIGLLPVVGDFITSLLSFYIILQAALLGAPPALLVRMSLNILVENIFDLVPLLGNIFDFYWKANIKNMQLLDAFLNRPQQVAWSSRLLVSVILLLILALLLLPVYLTYLLLNNLL